MTRVNDPDVAALSKALAADLDGLARLAPVPPAAAVWFRAERRARLDAMQRAEQPMWFAERLALVGAGVVLGWLSSFALPWLRTLDVAGAVGAVTGSFASSLGGTSMAGLAVTALCAVAASVGVMVATSGD